MEVLRQIDRMEKSTSRYLEDGITAKDYIQHFCFLFVLWDQRYILQYLIQVGMIVWRLLVLKLIFYETRWTPLAKRNLDVPGWVSRQHLLRIADWTEQALLYWSALIKTDILIKTDQIIFLLLHRPSYLVSLINIKMYWSVQSGRLIILWQYSSVEMNIRHGWVFKMSLWRII